MTQRNRCIDDDVLPVMVPRNDKALVPISPERVRRLRRHLVRSLRLMKDRPTASAAPQDAVGFTARVARAACSMCQGWCCRNGENDGFIDERTMERVHENGLATGARAMLRLYLERVPSFGVEGSCIFHGKQGCTLDRTLRSDVCNSYFCAGLHAYFSAGDATTPAVVIAGEGSRMRTSPILHP